MEKEQGKGFLNEEDKSKSTPNLLMLIGVIGGLLLFSVALGLDRKDAYLPLSSVVCVALGGVVSKAIKRTS